MCLPCLAQSYGLFSIMREELGASYQSSILIIYYTPCFLSCQAQRLALTLLKCLYQAILKGINSSRKLIHLLFICYTVSILPVDNFQLSAKGFMPPNSSQQPRAQMPRAQQPMAQMPRAQQPRAQMPRAQMPRAQQPRA